MILAGIQEFDCKYLAKFP